MKNKFTQLESSTTGAMMREATFQTMEPPCAPKPSQPIASMQTCEDCTSFTFRYAFAVNNCLWKTLIV